MSRLLFATARGARVQREQLKHNAHETWWEDVPIQWGLDDELRIHPDDEALQYGPISSALRNFANHGWFPDSLSGLMAEEVFKYEAGYVFHPGVSGEHLANLALLMAEALADEGL